MFDFYPTCLEKTKHVGIFTPRCYFPHMFGFWHICMGKGTHVWKKPHNYMFANVCHFPHMCGKSHWHAYFRLSYLCKMMSPQGNKDQFFSAVVSTLAWQPRSTSCFTLSASCTSTQGRTGTISSRSTLTTSSLGRKSILKRERRAPETTLLMMFSP